MCETKTCKTCKQVKPLEHFYSTLRTRKNVVKYEYHTNCMDCYRNMELQRRYGITRQEYVNQLTRQNHSCLICGKHQSTSKRAFHIDHCHRSGKLRGILCSNCNVALGLVQDNPEILKRMIQYLQ